MAIITCCETCRYCRDIHMVDEKTGTGRCTCEDSFRSVVMILDVCKYWEGKE